ncbi:hypothetical protein C3492_41155 [Streptomyces sp. Ru62]|nr:hypothetical protein C3492_41155 [Streptomyces sp. Ru62]
MTTHSAHHPALPPVSHYALRRAFDQSGITPREMWSGHVLDVAPNRDPIHLVHLFGIHPGTAVRYVHTAHPDKALHPDPLRRAALSSVCSPELIDFHMAVYAQAGFLGQPATVARAQLGLWRCGVLRRSRSALAADGHEEAHDDLLVPWAPGSFRLA